MISIRKENNWEAEGDAPYVVVSSDRTKLDPYSFRSIDFDCGLEYLQSKSGAILDAATPLVGADV